MSFKCYSQNQRKKPEKNTIWTLLKILMCVVPCAFFSFHAFSINLHYPQGAYLCVFVWVIVSLVMLPVLLKDIMSRQYYWYKSMIYIAYYLLLSVFFTMSISCAAVLFYPAPYKQYITNYRMVESGPRFGRGASRCQPGLRIKDPNTADSYLLCARQIPENRHPNKIIILSKDTFFGTYISEYYFIRSEP